MDLTINVQAGATNIINVGTAEQELAIQQLRQEQQSLGARIVTVEEVLASMQASIANIAGDIQRLKDQIAAIPGISPEILAQFEAVATQLADVAALTPEPPPVP